jgi:hypothetical protein
MSRDILPSRPTEVIVDAGYLAAEHVIHALIELTLALHTSA